MKNLKNIILSTCLVVTSILFITINDQLVEADSPAKKSIFIIDPSIDDPLYNEFILSTITTSKELRSNSAYKFFALNSPHESFEINGNQNDSEIYNDELKSWIKSIRDNIKEEEDTRTISGSLSDAINELNVTNSAEGSSVNFVLFDEFKIDSNEQKIIQSMIDTLSNKNWELNIIHKYGVSKTNLDKYQNWAKWGRGNIYPIVVPDTIELLTKKSLEENAERILNKDFKGIIDKNTLFQKEILVTPGSSELEIVLYTANSDGNVSILSPDNSTDDKINPSNLITTPFSKIWTYNNPTPGRWIFKISDYNSGLLSLYHRNKSDYNIVLVDKGPFPTKNSIQIVTNLVKDNDRLISSDAYVELIFDNKISYEMNDKGSKGDAVADDGYYSMIIPDVMDPGEYDVDIKFSWPDYGSSISESTKISFENFPEIRTDLLNTSELLLDTDVSIAIIEILLNNDKYYIDSEDIKWSFSSNQDSLDITLNPIDPIQDGRASKFEILLNTMDYGKASIVFRLDSTYKNKKFIMYSDTVVIKTIDEPIKEPVAEIVKDINTVDVIQDKIENQSNIMITTFIILAVIIIILISMGIYALINYSIKVDTRGYIYDDKNNMIFDINSINRSFVNKILNRNKIDGTDFNDDLFKGLEFKFMEGFLILANTSDQSVRVNNQPLAGSVEIYSKAWIGIQGKIVLYSEEML